MTDQPNTTFPPLRVNTDPTVIVKALKRGVGWYCVQTVLFIALAIFVSSWGFESGLGFMGIAFGFGAVVSLFQAVSTAQNLGVRSIVQEAMVLDEDGIHARVVGKKLDLPWELVQGVQLRKAGKHRVLAFELAPGTTPTTPGILSEITAAQFTVIAKKGFQIGSAGVDVPIQIIVDAASAFTDGRLRLQ